ncbi:MAG: pyrimidine 5'-nucleotidase, partial [Desulfuromonadales bacterium]|nr:pyrimidine 5'-nucleotidase [Desulfuromonadales bacterium]NIS43421.1 pyrimidine 5'-nucleotidase [Desulfuromonadales bacterium]
MKAILFDLDNTLYAPERRLFSLIDVRINRYMHEVAGIAPEEVDGLRRRYWREYGVTLQGLIRHHGVDPEDYLEYVHDVDVASRLSPDPHLRRQLSDLPLPKVIFTNGSRGHAGRVLHHLGIADQFDDIFDIRVAGYLPKPFRDPYDKVLGHLGICGSDCVMVEDSADNLKTAKDLGMRTVLVGGRREPFVD